MAKLPKNPNIKPNLDNIKGHNFRDMTPERMSEIARIGQKARAEKMRTKKLLAEVLLDNLDLADLDGVTIREKGVQALLVKYANGDVKAFEVVRDTVGEKPVERVSVKADVDAAVAEMEEYLAKCKKKR